MLPQRLDPGATAAGGGAAAAPAGEMRGSTAGAAAAEIGGPRLHPPFSPLSHREGRRRGVLKGFFRFGSIR